MAASADRGAVIGSGVYTDEKGDAATVLRSNYQGTQDTEKA